MSKYSKRRIAYIGNSADNRQIQDRRRFHHYSVVRNLSLSKSLENSDIIVVTPTSNLSNILMKKSSQQKLVLDLVDGYLFEEVSPIKDYGRGMLRAKFKALPLKAFSQLLREFAEECHAVVVASHEQAIQAVKLNDNVHVILDCHSEISPLPLSYRFEKAMPTRILWEGQSSNLKHLIPKIPMLLSNKDVKTLEILTNIDFYRFADRFIATKSEKHVNKSVIQKLQDRIRVTPWSIENMMKFALSSKYGVIPINESDQFAMAKPENKLLILWRIGLPAFVSPTPAYTRVLSQLGLEKYIIQSSQWGDFEFFCDLSDDWVNHRDIIQEYLNAENACQVIKQKWDTVLESIS